MTRTEFGPYLNRGEWRLVLDALNSYWVQCEREGELVKQSEVDKLARELEDYL